MTSVATGSSARTRSGALNIEPGNRPSAHRRGGHDFAGAKA